MAKAALHLVPEQAWLSFNLGISGAVALALHGHSHERVHLVAAGPDVAQKHILALRVLAQGLVLHVFEHAARNGVGHHQGRTG